MRTVITCETPGYSSAVQKEHPKLPKWHQTRANAAVGGLCHHPMTTEGSAGGAPGSSHQAELAPDLSWAKGRAGKAKPPPHSKCLTTRNKKGGGSWLQEQKQKAKKQPTGWAESCLNQRSGVSSSKLNLAADKHLIFLLFLTCLFSSSDCCCPGSGAGM